MTDCRVASVSVLGSVITDVNAISYTALSVAWVARVIATIATAVVIVAVTYDADGVRTSRVDCCALDASFISFVFAIVTTIIVVDGDVDIGFVIVGGITAGCVAAGRIAINLSVAANSRLVGAVADVDAITG